MGGNINKVILVGRLGADPETRTLTGGNVMVKFPIATSTGFGDKESTDWHRVATFGKVAEQCARVLSKGQLCYLEGRVTYRKHEREGKVMYFTDVIASKVEFLSPRAKGTAPPVHEEDATLAGEQIPF